MRLIGHLKDEVGARTFGAYLTSVDIRNLVEPENEGIWAVWVYNEDQITSGQAALQEFLQNPRDAKYTRAQEKAAAIERRRQLDEKAAAKRTLTRDHLRRRSGMPVTLTMMALSIIVTLICWVSPMDRIWVLFSLPEVLHGEIWRLVTPIFLHFGLLHILFDMWWLWDLGGLLERHGGSGRLLLMTLILAIVSNACQYFAAGPGFGGFSGVIYGYFGYVWIRSRVDPFCGLMVSPQGVMMMLGWYVLCWAGLVGDIANWCHTGGLVAGMIWGALPRLGLDRR